MRLLLIRLAHLGRRVTHAGFKLVLGRRTRPVFFDIDGVRPELRRIDAEFAAIRAEVEALMPERHRMPRYHEFDPAQEAISKGPADWRVLYLRLSNVVKELSSAALCPRTMAAIRRVPGVTGAFFSILEPHKSVPPHTGPYAGCLRYHLGLIVPAQNPPTMRVRDRRYTWKEGESIVFDDSYQHEVYNDCDRVRVVLVVDFFRPMAWPLALWNRTFCWLFNLAYRTRSIEVMRGAIAVDEK